MKIELKVTQLGLEKYEQLTEIVSVALANEVMAKLKQDTPRPPTPGSMKFKSDKQRKFVMAAIARGDITVPYQRGSSKTKGSASLQSSYRVYKDATGISLSSHAPYVNYVVGDQQADIHKGRWRTAIEVTNDLISTGVIDTLVSAAIADMEKQS